MVQTVPPPGWSGDTLTEYLEFAHKNRWATFANKGHQVRRLIDIDGNFIKIEKDWTNPSNLLVPQFFFRAHSAFRASCEHALAGQVSDAYPVLRSSLEFAAYGLFIDGNEQRGEIWLRRHDDEAALKRVKSEFTVRNLKQNIAAKDGKLAEAFDELYQRCIDFGAHPNERSISASGAIEERDGNVIYSQLLLHGDGPAFDFVLRSTAQVGICVLQIFQFALAARFELLGVKHELPRLRVGL